MRKYKIPFGSSMALDHNALRAKTWPIADRGAERERRKKSIKKSIDARRIDVEENYTQRRDT